ncbi:hypothetical protein [Methylocucumis oryzae]|uniref:DUF1640 domain-containing protein n=1 Tax=Methylocucumis oryzae TaxID=1632867 RepID=A0A0F3IL83_9GAMM|nr:hypothetical protein [Methylocucumis oryzae]KJV06319.1 hypothetical protein VZ94_12000 [Methylocucumis oryzae]
MATITFDTLELVDKLKAAGFEQAQAETVVRVISQAQDNLVSNATLDHRLKETELRLEASINDIKFDLVKWIAGMLLAQAGLVAALVKLL